MLASINLIFLFLTACCLVCCISDPEIQETTNIFCILQCLSLVFYVVSCNKKGRQRAGAFITAIQPANTKDNWVIQI